MLRQNLAMLGHSATLQANETCQQLLSEGKDVYRLSFGQSPFPIPATLQNNLQKHVDKNKYLPVAGLYELRQQLAEEYSQLYKTTIQASQVVIGPGSKELLFLLCCLCQKKFIIPTPSWVSYQNQLDCLGTDYQQIHTTFDSQWKINTSELQNQITENSLLIITSPDNPTGMIYTQDEIQSLVNVCKERNTWILSDEIYSKLSRVEYTSPCQYYPEGTIITSGISKCYAAGGWRLGYMVFPSELSELCNQIVKLGSETYSCANAPVQYALLDSFANSNSLKEYTRHCTHILSHIGQNCADTLNTRRIHCHSHQGGFYLLLDYSFYSDKIASKGIKSNIDLCQVILQESGVSLLAGSYFGRKDTEWLARFAFVDFDGKLALQNYQHDIDLAWLQQYCSRILEGVNQLIAWFAALDNGLA